MANLPTLSLTLDGSHSGRFADFLQIFWQKWGYAVRCADFHQICKHKWRGNYFCWPIYCPQNLPVDLFLLLILYQRVCFNAIFLYFLHLNICITFPNAKSVLFTQISNSYLVCCNKLKFPCKN